MAGTLVITTLSDGTNSTSATNAIQGSAKAWVSYKGTATRAINASYNVSSITVNGTGDFTVNFTNALADANYAIAGGPLEGTGTGINAILTYASGGYGSAPTLKTTTQYRFVTSNIGTPSDANSISLSFFR